MRSKSDEIELLSYERSYNENGVPQNSETARTVFAEVKSVSRAEYWRAQQNGVSLTAVFCVRLADYENERIVRYDGQLYRVQRAPCPDGEWVELNCSDEVV